MKSFIALLAIVGFAAAEIGFGPCPDFQGISDFQVGDYLGLWYEVERYEQEFQLNGECVTAQYSANDDGSVRVWNTLEVLAVAPGDENQLFSMEGRAVLADPLADPLVGALNVTFGGEPDVTNYHIIGTDYENFAVVFNCFEILPNITDKVFWVLSRTPVLHLDVVDDVNNIIDDVLALDRDYIRVTVQDDRCVRGESN